MENIEENYSEGGSFETTIGNTQYEVVINFKQESLVEHQKQRSKEMSGGANIVEQ